MSPFSESLRELHQETLLHHGRHPRNFVSVPPTEAALLSAEGFNPLCGDRQIMHVRLDKDNCIEEVRFEGSGCAISMASASMMSEAVHGLNNEDFERLFASFRAMAGGSVNGASPELISEYPDLEVFAGVREFPMRVKCATLPWHALHAALHGKSEVCCEE